MKIKVQLIVCAEDGREEQGQEVAVLEKPHQQIEHLGFTLAEAKAILKTLQQHLVERGPNPTLILLAKFGFFSLA